MILVLEGPDGAGKTTFARSFGGRYHHEGPPPAMPPTVNLVHHYIMLVEDAARRPAQTTVFDRLALGELVYGPILRGRSRITSDEYLRFLSITRDLGAVHVLCLPPRHVCRANWERRRAVGQELFSDPERFDRTWEAFARLSGEADFTYDYTKGLER